MYVYDLYLIKTQNITSPKLCLSS